MAIAIPETEPVAIRVDAAGVPRIGASRVMAALPLLMYRDGHPVEALQAAFPSLDPGDLLGAISYYLHHRADLDSYLDEVAADAAALRDSVERDDRYRPWRAEFANRAARVDSSAL